MRRRSFRDEVGWQETCNGRICDVYELQPNPDFHPRSLVQDILTRVTAKIWVDREANQLVRGEAHVTRDISFGGGILGKLYRGGVFYMEQEEVTPGIWFPTRYQYDYTARKFLFMFEEHQYVEARQYRRVGPPKQALVIVQQRVGQRQNDIRRPVTIRSISGPSRVQPDSHGRTIVLVRLCILPSN